jgi:signal transduction histidine kinase
MDTELVHAFDGVVWDTDPGAEEEMREIHPLTAGVLFYAAREIIRNAARYGRPADRPLNLRIRIARQDGAEITIEDDGVGLEGGRTSDEGVGKGWPYIAR